MCVLAGLAGRGDLPAEERTRGAPLNQRLDGVAIGARSRPDRFGNVGDDLARLPGPPKKLR